MIAKIYPPPWLCMRCTRMTRRLVRVGDRNNRVVYLCASCWRDQAEGFDILGSIANYTVKAVQRERAVRSVQQALEAAEDLPGAYKANPNG